MAADAIPLDPDSLCDSIATLDQEIGAFVPEPHRRDRLRAQAIAEGPLRGVPVGIKDIIHVDGLPTAAGSALDPQVLTGPQASVVTRLLEAGAVIAGKTVTAEFAVTAPNQTRNPRNLAHTPGGSSSGSAAAVAAGMVPLAIGTQTIGSVIRPAAFCGVLGFKPTYGRIPIDGVIANAPTFDTLGVFACELAQLQAAAQVVCDGWQPRVAAGPPVLGIPDGPYLEKAEAGALAAFERQVQRLQDAGIQVRRVPAMRDFQDTLAVSFIINRYEVARSHAGWFPRFGELYRPETVDAISQGRQIAEADYHAALEKREGFGRDIVAAMGEVDLWVAPSAPGPAPLGIGSTGDPVMCLPWSHARLPAISLPAGCAENGLPLGIQLVGRPDTDEQLLSWAGPVAAALG